MIAGIITTPNRQQYLPELVKLIAPHVDSIKIFNDIHLLGHTYNLQRCMRLLDVAGINEEVFIMTDDVITVPDWHDRYKQIRQECHVDIYQFMSRQRHIFKPENLERGYVTGTFKQGFYDHAVVYVNQWGLVDKINAWFNHQGKDIITGTRQNHYDNIIQGYLVANEIKWCITTPTLFNHIGVKSTMKHQIGESVKYLGNL